MSVFKWVGASLGWALGGPIGAILGIALGSLGDAFSKDEKEREERYYKNQERYTRVKQETQPGDFEVSLLILAAKVIKADGIQDKRELEVVRKQFVSMYGKERANNAFKLFKSISQQEISIRQVCLQIKSRMQLASRLQLVHFLFEIAQADGHVHDKELYEIQLIANYLNVGHGDFESIKAMFYNSSDSAFKILEIPSSASNDEIKKAYRKMAKKYHPDKVEHLGDAHKKGAEAKFKEVVKAYEQLQKERGF